MTSRSSYTSRNTQTAHFSAATYNGLAVQVWEERSHHQHKQHWVTSHIYGASHHLKISDPEGVTTIPKVIQCPRKLKSEGTSEASLFHLTSELRLPAGMRGTTTEGRSLHNSAEENSLFPAETTGGKSFKSCTYFRRIICSRKWPSNKTWTYTN